MLKLRKFALAGLVAMAASLPTGQSAQAQVMQIGDIIMGGWNFCPRGTIPAAGQLLAVGDNDALFSLYGTIYGGDGRTTFGLPDLRGRAPLHFGSGPGLASVSLGAKGGAEQVTMNASTMPSHTHTFSGNGSGRLVGSSATAAATSPLNQTYAATAENQYGTPANQPMAVGTATMSLDGHSTASTGGSQSIPIRDPFEAIQFCVVLFGIYPSRN
ncbi:MAG: tail fiber protein [Pseudomonadota bacterium]